MLKVRLILTAIADMFRFLQRRRERLAEAQRAERQHQLAIVRELVQGFVELARANQDGLLEIAKAQVAQAEAFQIWLKGFQNSNVDPQPSSVVTDEDEWAEEQRRLGIPPEIANLPPEFQLAAALEQMNAAELADFDREGRDFLRP